MRRLSSILLLAFVASVSTAQDSSDQEILHVLNRVTFGPRPGDVEAVRKMGLRNWIQSQLHPETIPESANLEEKLKPLTTLRMNLSQSMESTSNMRVVFDDVVFTVDTATATSPSTPSQSAPSMRRVDDSQTPEGQLRNAKVYRAVYSNRQLEEVLVDFWFNHFNVSSMKSRPFVTDYEREAIRPFVLGKFRDMLFATAFHPAMMLYLDNKESIAPEIAGQGTNTTVQLGSAKGLNENYSRELMELHTLGVDGGYTQKDIEQAARTFTGWSLRQTSASVAPRQPAKVELLFYDWAHDPKDKVVLGQTIASEGVYEVKRLLNILAGHPSTARHISFQLAQRFVADSPPKALVDRMAKTFMDTDGDLREVMTTLLTSPEFLSEDIWQKKMKSPLEVAASAVRAVNGEMMNPSELGNWIADMGEPLYGKVEPTGYPNTGESWFNSATLLARLNFAMAVANGTIPGLTVDKVQWNGKDTASIARSILGRDLTSQTLDSLKNSKVAGDVTPAFIAGLIMGSPDFQRR